MRTYKYEALDTTGREVKDSISAMSEEEAQQKIKQMGYFVNRIGETSDAKKLRDEGADPMSLYISPLAFLRSMGAILWTSFRHPFKTTEVDLSTGQVVRHYQMKGP